MVIGAMTILYILFWAALAVGTIGGLIYFLVRRPSEVEQEQRQFDHRDN